MDRVARLGEPTHLMNKALPYRFVLIQMNGCILEGLRHDIPLKDVPDLEKVTEDLKEQQEELPPSHKRDLKRKLPSHAQRINKSINRSDAKTRSGSRLSGCQRRINKKNEFAKYMQPSPKYACRPGSGSCPIGARWPPTAPPIPAIGPRF